MRVQFYQRLATSTPFLLRLPQPQRKMMTLTSIHTYMCMGVCGFWVQTAFYGIYKIPIRVSRAKQNQKLNNKQLFSAMPVLANVKNCRAADLRLETCETTS